MSFLNPPEAVRGGGLSWGILGAVSHARPSSDFVGHCPPPPLLCFPGSPLTCLWPEPKVGTGWRSSLEKDGLWWRKDQRSGAGGRPRRERRDWGPKAVTGIGHTLCLQGAVRTHPRSRGGAVAPQVESGGQGPGEAWRRGCLRPEGLPQRDPPGRWIWGHDAAPQTHSWRLPGTGDLEQPVRPAWRRCRSLRENSSPELWSNSNCNFLQQGQYRNWV